MASRTRVRDLLLLLLLAGASLLIHGYHYGYEDSAIYLPAIEKLLTPSLFPFDTAFCIGQTQWMIFPEMVAETVRVTGWPLEFAVFGWHFLSVFLVLIGCRELSKRCFTRPSAQWAAVAAVWATLPLPIAGSELEIMDRYLHPRNLATAAILFALVAILDRRERALAWLAAAVALHPPMAIYGAFHLGIQAWKIPRRSLAMLFPLALMVFAPSNRAWEAILASRPYLYPLRWHWYEWLGVAMPLLLLWGIARIARRRGEPMAGHVAEREVVAGVLGVAASLVVTTVPALARFALVEPMRILHLMYLLFVFLAGGLIGGCVLRERPLRWLLFFAPICATFFATSLVTHPGSRHVEWPGLAPKNQWVTAFDWARRNTPHDALFALDPRYMLRPGEDLHGFRAFAERSMLADWVKDRAVAAIEPGLAWTWEQEVRARENWRNFRAGDFRRLKKDFGVGWVVVERDQVPGTAESLGLACPYSNPAVLVCRIK